MSESPTVSQRTTEFDRAYGEALRRIWFVGDVHGRFIDLARTLMAAKAPPRWIVFAGDLDIDHKPLREFLEPLARWDSSIRIAFVHGNHDADSYAHWDMLHDAGDAMPIHGQVVEMEGVRVAGLGGHFVERVWMPPAAPLLRNRAEAVAGGAFRFRGGVRLSSTYLGAIYADEVDGLCEARADLLVTHEAPSCHPYGHAELDRVARSLGTQRIFHGHHHDDRTAQYALQREQLGFEAIGLRYCQIKNGLGEEIFEGDGRW